MKEYEGITHNLANISTTGFKRRVNSFSRELMDKMSIDGDDSLTSGKVNIESAIDFSGGTFQRTGRTLDVAISGKGFFVVETPDGPLYTRNGVFELNQQGQMVNASGRIIAGEDGPIAIPQSVSTQQIGIAEDGSISANGISLGKLKVVDFGADESKLAPVGGSCFELTDDNVISKPAAEAVLRQEYRENSNVNWIEELAGMITVTRLYEMNTGMLKKRQENAKAILAVANA